jgi:ribosomal 50S subunit-associated protein YjgA (DUF615 family)
MSQYQNATSDPKKQFLNMLVHEHFNINNLVHTSETGTRKPILKQIDGLATIITELLPDQDKQTIQQLQKTIDKYTQPNAPIIEYTTIKNMFQTLTQIITRNFYADLQLGLIPANTIQTQTERPKQQTADPNRTAKI